MLELITTAVKMPMIAIRIVRVIFCGFVIHADYIMPTSGKGILILILTW